MKVEGVASVEVRTISAHSGGSDDVTEDDVPLCEYTSRCFKFCVTMRPVVISALQETFLVSQKYVNLPIKPQEFRKAGLFP